MDIAKYMIYRAWLQLEPCRSVEALPRLGAISMEMAEIFQDPCSDRLFFSKHHSDKSIAIIMATISMSFPSDNSAEIQAIASGTDYEIHKDFKQKYLFSGIVNKNGFGVLESSQKSSQVKYRIILDPSAVLECEGYVLEISESLADTQSIILKPDGMFSVNPSLVGKKISAYLQVVLLEAVVISKNQPLPAITLNTILKSKNSDQFFLATIANCRPVLEQFDPDAQNICLRLAFDEISVTPMLLS